MPIYEFECSGCQVRFEKLVFRGDEAVCCDTCGSAEVQRVMSVFGFRSGGDKGAASSRMSTASSGCSGCAGGNCSSCH